MGLAHLRLIGVERQGSPDFGAARILESGRHDSDDHISRAVEIHRLPDYVRVGAETVAPQTVTEHRHRIVIRLVLFGAEHSPMQRAYAEDREEIGGDEGGDYWFGLIPARQRLLLLPPGGYTDQRSALPAPVEEIRGSYFQALTRHCGVCLLLVNSRQLGRPRIRQWPQQHRVDYAEY